MGLRLCESEYWADFYTKFFNFQEIRYFDINGEYTGLASKAMSAPDGLIRIPLNEESGKTGGQIEEFLLQFNGEGIQHVALLTDDLKASLDALQLAGIPLMTAPNDSYYEMLEERLPGHGEAVSELQTRGILLDGSTANGEKRLLLQIFSQCLLGPVFFEFIERKNDEGFGEGNFKALFESLERDQLRRGAIHTKDSWSVDHLRTALLSELQRQRILEEILEGEAAINPGLTRNMPKLPKAVNPKVA